MAGTVSPQITDEVSTAELSEKFKSFSALKICALSTRAVPTTASGWTIPEKAICPPVCGGRFPRSQKRVLPIRLALAGRLAGIDNDLRRKHLTDLHARGSVEASLISITERVAWIFPPGNTNAEPEMLKAKSGAPTVGSGLWNCIIPARAF